MKGKVQGGSLFHALAISVIVGFVLSGVILAQCCHLLLLRGDLIEMEVQRNAESGIYLACADTALISADVDLFGRGKDSVKLQRTLWGVYHVVTATAHTGASSHTVHAMSGAYVESGYTLWLADMDKPLSVSGNTQLNGPCYLPKSGIQRAYMEGRSFSGRNLVNGTIQESSRFMPECNTRIAESVIQLIQHPESAGDSLITFTEISNEGEVRRSFSDAALVVSETDRLVIRSIKLHGHILIRSATSITVERDAELDNVVLVAPVIRINDGVEGRFQVLCCDSVIVGNDVQLSYPSVLCVVAGKWSVKEPFVVIGENCTISGEVFMINNDNTQQRNAAVRINAESNVYGHVYCAGSIDLKGSVTGSVCCSRFVLHTNSAVYDNHLLDAVIDVNARSGDWLCCALNRKERNDHVIQWLD